VTVLVWVLPVVAGTVAITGLGLGFVRWRRATVLGSLPEEGVAIAQPTAPRSEGGARSAHRLRQRVTLVAGAALVVLAGALWLVDPFVERAASRRDDHRWAERRERRAPGGVCYHGKRPHRGVGASTTMSFPTTPISRLLSRQRAGSMPRLVLSPRRSACWERPRALTLATTFHTCTGHSCCWTTKAKPCRLPGSSVGTWPMDLTPRWSKWPGRLWRRRKPPGHRALPAQRIRAPVQLKNCRRSASPTCSARTGGTALPTWRYWLDRRPAKAVQAGKLCSSAASSTVIRRAPGTRPCRGEPPASRWAWYPGTMPRVSTHGVLLPPCLRASSALVSSARSGGRPRYRGARGRRWAAATGVRHR